jgi:hypothetical protein
MKLLILLFFSILIFITSTPIHCGTGMKAVLELEEDFESDFILSKEAGSGQEYKINKVNYESEDPCVSENICIYNGKTFNIDLNEKTPILMKDWFNQCKRDLYGKLG